MPSNMQLDSVTRCPGNGSAHVLDVINAKKRPVKRAGVLPFGLKRPPRKRQKKSVKPKMSAIDDTSPLVTHEDLDSGSGFKALVAADMLEDADESMASSHMSDSGGSDSDSSSHDTEGEEVPAFPAQRNEERATREILRESAALFAVAEEQPVPQPVPPVVLRPERVTTQCNMSLGVCEVGWQTAARLAKCKFCSNKIQRGDGRVGYAFSKIKFHCWVHAGCFKRFLLQEHGDVRQAVNFIQDWLAQKTDSPDVPSTVRTELCKVVSELESAVD